MKNPTPNSIFDRDDTTREILDTFPVGVTIVSHDQTREDDIDKRLFVNTAFVHLFGGQSKKELVGQNVADSWVDPERLKEFKTAMKVQDELIDFEAKRTCLDGREIWVSLHSRNVRFQNQNCIMVWHFDITERKGQERLANDLFMAIESLSEGVTLFDAKDRLLYVNKSWRIINSSVPENHVKGTYFEDHLKILVERNLAPGARGREMEWIAERLNRHRNPTGPFEIQRDDVRLLVNEQRLSGGGIATLYTDISKLAELENRLSHSQRLEAVGQLTGGIAHDFNNILGIVLGNLEIIQSLPPGDSRITDRIDVARRSIERGAEITRKLLGFSRKDAHEMQLVDINGSVNNLLDLITKSLTVSIGIKTYLANDLWTVEIDPGDFEDAILNLALNAHDAMPDGGTLTIETANKVLDEEYVRHNPNAAVGSFVLVTISDTGTGMTDEIKSKIFEPFFTSKEVGKGTGLGLSMVYGFVERSGGFITIDTAIDKGTAFQLYIPRAIENEISVDEPEVTPDNLPRGHEKILIVDDEEGLRDIAAFYLGELGYKTFIAEDGPSALKTLKQERDIDLLFSDVVMPNFVSGYALARKAHEGFPQLKILLTSGYDKKLDKTEISDAPFLMSLHKTQLKKPYAISELAIAIRKALDEKL